MKFFKKIVLFFCDKDVWLATAVDSIGWFIFLFLGGYIAFITEIEPKIKIGSVVLLGIFLYVFCMIAKRFVFKRLGRKVPI
jgi:hypothetical protein